MALDAHSVPIASRLAARWAAGRTFSPDRVPPVSDLVARKRSEDVRISVAIPALNEGSTIGRICHVVHDELMTKARLVDEVVVLDGESIDETALHAQAAGARVVDVARIMPEVMPFPGKGDSLWRSLSVLRGDIVVWIDADIRNFGPHFVTRLVAPLLIDPSVDFVKGFYRRPIELDGVLHPSGGGRVTELLARPLLDLLFPELGGFFQPLAGEYAGRAEVLRRIPFLSGYSVEAAMLIDLLDVTGLEGMAQADLGRRIHRNRPLDELSVMAHAIARTILRRAEERGRIKSSLDFPSNPLLVRADGMRLVPASNLEIERPPIEISAAYRAALRDTLSCAAR